MEYDKLPPPPQLRIFTKGELIVANICSLAGISSSFFISSPEGTLLVDAGDGSLRDMIELARLSAMFQAQGGQEGHTKRTENLIGAPIVRTERGRELLERAVDEGRLKRPGIKRRLFQDLMDTYWALKKKRTARVNIRKRRK